MRELKIIKNSAKCRKCGDEIESKSRYDFVSCECGAIFVDGGKHYLRGGGNFEDFLFTGVVEEVKQIPNDNFTNQLRKK